MINQHPITPPPELVEQWEEQFLERPTINGCFIQSYIAAKAAQWGADQELEACIELLKADGYTAYVKDLCAARRPKPPSLKEQALRDLDALAKDLERNGMGFGTAIQRFRRGAVIRRALEQLND